MGNLIFYHICLHGISKSFIQFAQLTWILHKYKYPFSVNKIFENTFQKMPNYLSKNIFCWQFCKHLSLPIFIYLDLSWQIRAYLDPPWPIWTFLAYLYLSWPILNYLDVSDLSCKVHVANRMLQTACFKLHVSNCMLQTACCKLHVTNFMLQTACCMLNVACCKLHVANSMLQIAGVNTLN